jgi:ELWxxDGT repeat protein
MSRGDNRLRGARNISSAQFTRSDKVGKSDVEDLYRFRATDKSSLDATLSGLSRKASVSIELYRMKQPADAVLRKLGRTDFGRLKSRDRNALLQFQGAARGRSTTKGIKREVEAGDYVIRVVRSSGESRYRFNLTSSPVVPPPPIDPPKPPVPPDGNVGEEETPGNSFNQANPVSFPLTAPLSGFVNDQDGRDFYKVTTGEAGDYQIRLSGLGDNANIEIYDANRNLVKASRKSGTSQEALIQPQDAGSNFFIKVLQNNAGVATPYNLEITKLTDSLSDDATAPAEPTLSNGDAIFTNYVVAGGKDSPKDVFKFTIAPNDEKKSISIELTGLEDNLDVLLYKEGGSAATSLLPKRPSSSAEIHRGALSDGTYFLEIVPGDPVATSGSTYNLKLRLTDGKDIPLQVRDINYGTGSSDPQNVTSVGGRVYFTAVDAFDNTTALWVSDGTLDTTQRIRGNFRSASQFTRVGDKLFFSATDATDGDTELWISDGTDAGTRSLNIRPGVGVGNSADPRQLTAVGSQLYFVSTVSEGGQSVDKFMRADTTGAVQTLATTVTVGGSVVTLDPLSLKQLKAINNDLYFVGDDNDSATSVAELYRITGAGTGSSTIEMVNGESGGIDNNSTSNSFGSGITPELTVIGDKIYTPARVRNGNISQINLVQISASGVTRVNVIAPPLEVSGGPSGLAIAGTTLYFNDNEGVLYKVNNAGTISTFDANSIARIKDLDGVTNVTAATGDSVYFFANDPNNSSIKRLWKSDGTENGTTIVTATQNVEIADSPELVVVGDRVFFRANTTETVIDPDTGQPVTNLLGADLWAWNTTSNVATSIPIGLLGDPSNPKNLINTGADTPALFDDALFFVADDGLSGNELWTL